MPRRAANPAITDLITALSSGALHFGRDAQPGCTPTDRRLPAEELRDRHLIVLAIIVIVGLLFARQLQRPGQAAEQGGETRGPRSTCSSRRRYDLIPNLVETVKGYAAHERQTLER